MALLWLREREVSAVRWGKRSLVGTGIQSAGIVRRAIWQTSQPAIVPTGFGLGARNNPRYLTKCALAKSMLSWSHTEKNNNAEA